MASTVASTVAPTGRPLGVHWASTERLTGKTHTRVFPRTLLRPAAHSSRAVSRKSPRPPTARRWPLRWSLRSKDQCHTVFVPRQQAGGDGRAGGRTDVHPSGRPSVWTSVRPPGPSGKPPVLPSVRPSVHLVAPAVRPAGRPAERPAGRPGQTGAAFRPVPPTRPSVAPRPQDVARRPGVQAVAKIVTRDLPERLYSL